MKLVVIIPAFNEELTIADVVAGIPRSIPQISSVEVVVVNDGSTDATHQRAIAAGADYIVDHRSNLGLAQAFRSGLAKAFACGADVIVNIDADGQQDQNEIPALIKPILEGTAGMVVGNRNITNTTDMHRAKKYGNMIGDRVVGWLAGVADIDVSSGFRAFSKEAAMRLTVSFGHTYTHQTVIEASYKRLGIASVPITVRPREQGQSKLVTNIVMHISRSVFIIVRTLLIYRPLRTCLSVGTVFLFFGLLLGLRYMYYFFLTGPGRLQSLILLTIVIVFGLLLYVVGFLGDLIALNRRLNEEIHYELKVQKYGKISE